MLFSDHHLSHAASAFFPSPFESAALLTIDGVGEWTYLFSNGKGNDLKVIKNYVPTFYWFATPRSHTTQDLKLTRIQSYGLST